MNSSEFAAMPSPKREYPILLSNGEVSGMITLSESFADTLGGWSVLDLEGVILCPKTEGGKTVGFSMRPVVKAAEKKPSVLSTSEVYMKLRSLMNRIAIKFWGCYRTDIGGLWNSGSRRMVQTLSQLQNR